MTFRTLLYRYFFFSWLFKDVGRGNQFERLAAWRHNQAQARWLPVYMKRWLAFGLVLFLSGTFVDVGLGAPVASSLLYVPGVLSLPVNAVIVALWAGLKMLSGPL